MNTHKMIPTIEGWGSPSCVHGKLWVVPSKTTLPKSHESWTRFLLKKLIYLYIGLFDWTRWAMFSPLMHTLMKNNEHPKTYNMH